MTSPIRHLALACAAVAPMASLRAATYTNIATNPASSTWNAAAYWGSNPSPVSSGNDYQVNPDATRVTENNPIATSFTVQVGVTSTAWRMFGFVRDYGGTPAADSIFLGDRIILTDKTAFRSFNRNFTSVANWEMQNGSYMVLNAGGPGTTTAWNGSITTSGTTALGLITNNATALTVNASIAGTGTLNLVQSGGSVSNLNLVGDISQFTGTLLLSGSTQANANTRTFSIANSATSATLQLNWETAAFHYDLAENNISFASLILGTDTILDPGIYTAADLNDLTGNAGVFSGSGGTITVIPEPAAFASLLGGLGLLLLARRKR